MEVLDGAVLVHLLGGYHQEVLGDLLHQGDDIPFAEDPIFRQEDSVKAIGDDDEGDEKKSSMALKFVAGVLVLIGDALNRWKVVTQVGKNLTDLKDTGAV